MAITLSVWGWVGRGSVELVCIKYPTVMALVYEITAHGTRDLETPGP